LLVSRENKGKELAEIEEQLNNSEEVKLKERQEEIEEELNSIGKEINFKRDIKAENDSKINLLEEEIEAIKQGNIDNTEELEAIVKEIEEKEIEIKNLQEEKDSREIEIKNLQEEKINKEIENEEIEKKLFETKDIKEKKAIFSEAEVKLNEIIKLDEILQNNNNLQNELLEKIKNLSEIVEDLSESKKIKLIEQENIEFKLEEKKEDILRINQEINILDSEID
ncbi:hypothetical protein Q604_UNBC10158G0001, partial [human gut metagenome]